MIDPLCDATAAQYWGVAAIALLAGLVFGITSRFSLSRVWRQQRVNFMSPSAFAFGCLFPIAFAIIGSVLTGFGTPSVDECMSTDVAFYPLVGGGVTGVASLLGFAAVSWLLSKP